MRRRLAWNNGKSDRPFYRPVSVLWHTLFSSVWDSQTPPDLAYLTAQHEPSLRNKNWTVQVKWFFRQTKQKDTSKVTSIIQSMIQQHGSAFGAFGTKSEKRRCAESASLPVQCIYHWWDRCIRITYRTFFHATHALLPLGFLDYFLWEEDNFLKTVVWKFSDFKVRILK